MASPIIAAALADQISAEDTLWVYQVPADAFSDADGDALTYSAKLADGLQLPEWLTFDAATRTFSGTPPLNFNGSLNLSVTATDGAANTTDSFSLTVSPVNDLPTGTLTFKAAPSAEFRVNTTTLNEQLVPTVTSLVDGGWIVTWTSNQQNASGFDIYGQRYGADGALICPLLGGPKSMLFWTRKEKTNAIQETHAGGDYRQAA